METPTPQQLQLMITERCNLRCVHCAVPEEDSPAAEELSTEQWKRFVSLAAQRGVPNITFSGGEAFLRQDIVELAKWAHECGVSQTTIVTNLSLITQVVAEQVAVAQAEFPTFGLQVSIDGATGATHDWMRARGNLKVLLRNAERLRSAGGRITGVNSVLHQGNFGQLDDLAALAARLGAAVWCLFPIADIGRGNRLQEQVLTAGQWAHIVECVPYWKAKFAYDVMLMGPILGPKGWESEVAMPRPNMHRTPRYVVGPDGDMFVCPPLRHHSLGNAGRIATLDDWTSPLAKGFEISQRNCHTCEFLLVCVGLDTNEPYGRPSEAGTYGPPK